MYNKLIKEKREPVTSVNKRLERGFIFNNKDWNKIFELLFKTTKESKLQWIQFQRTRYVICQKLSYL